MLYEVITLEIVTADDRIVVPGVPALHVDAAAITEVVDDRERLRRVGADDEIVGVDAQRYPDRLVVVQPVDRELLNVRPAEPCPKAATRCSDRSTCRDSGPTRDSGTCRSERRMC